MKKTKRTAILSVILLHCLGMMAQMSDPREKLSITATVDGNTNSEYYWETEDGQRQESGKLRQGINARLKANVKHIGHKRFSLTLNSFYNFSTRSLKADVLGPQLQLPIPDAHHHYGAGFTGAYNTRWLGKPFTLMAIVSGNFSQYGYENPSAIAGAMFTITRTPKTYLALGGIYLLGTSASPYPSTTDCGRADTTKPTCVCTTK